MAKKTIVELLRLANKEVVELKRALRLANTLMDKDHKGREEVQHKLDWEKRHAEQLGKTLKETREENRALKKAMCVSKEYVRMLLKEGITEHRIEIAYDMGGIKQDGEDT